MKTIWKFELFIQDQQCINMPENSALLAVQAQGGVICLWALVMPKNPMTNRKIRMSDTEHTLPDDFNVADTPYIGTVQTHEGSLVWHVFDEGAE